jgi:hypothetical protein
MVGDDDLQPQQDFDQGAKRTPEGPGDKPGYARGPAFVLVVILSLLTLAVPVAWGAGYLVVLADVLGAAAYTILLIIWVIIVLITVWTIWSMWRRAA